tara:strand:- start:44 stop:442 length:399 start_codon:yes stop_codon:yes gene_type:complete
MVALDIARTEEDFRQCAELLTKTHPDDELPNFASPRCITFIIFDTEDRSKVRGCIYTNLIPEIRSLSVDPEYRFQDASRAMLQQFSDAHFRTQDFESVVHTVPKSSDQIKKMIRKSGGTEINQNDVRYRKEL